MEKWEQDLQGEIGSRPIIIVEKTSKFYLFFVFLVLLLSVAFVYSYKNIVGFKSWVSEHFKIDNIKNISEKSHSNYDVLLEKIKEFEGELKINSFRIKNLGISHNENFSIMNGDDLERFIILNHDWTMSRFPINLNIKEEDKSYIDRNSSKP